MDRAVAVQAASFFMDNAVIHETHACRVAGAGECPSVITGSAAFPMNMGHNVSPRG